MGIPSGLFGRGVILSVAKDPLGTLKGILLPPGRDQNDNLRSWRSHPFPARTTSWRDDGIFNKHLSRPTPNKEAPVFSNLSARIPRIREP